MRQTAKRRARNQSTKRNFRDELKILNGYIESKNGKKAAEQFKVVQGKIDTAVKKNLLKKNTAARKLSRLSAQIKAIGAKPTPSVTKKPVAKTTKTTKSPATKKPVAKKTASKTTKKPATKK